MSTSLPRTSCRVRGIGAGSGADVAGRRGGGRGVRLCRRGRRLCQGAPAIRPHHRHFPSGEASLREHVVAAESAIAAVSDASRAAAEDEEQFRLIAAVAARGTLPGLRAQRRTQHSGRGGIGFTWNTMRICICAVRSWLRHCSSGDSPQRCLRSAPRPAPFREQPGPAAEAEELRKRIHADAAEIAALDKKAQRDKLIETGYVMPHWPKPWSRGRRRGAIRDRGRVPRGGRQAPRLLDYRMVILTLIQRGTDAQSKGLVEKALRRTEHVVPAVLRARSRVGCGIGEDSRHPVDGGWKINGQKVLDQRGAVLRARPGHRAHRPRRQEHAGITTVIVDMDARRSERFGQYGRSPAARSSTRCSSTTCFVQGMKMLSGPPIPVDGRRGRRWATAGEHRRQRIVLRDRAGMETRSARSSIRSVGARRSGSEASWQDDHAGSGLFDSAPCRPKCGGSGPRSGRQRHQTRAETGAMIEGGAISAALLGAEVALLDGPGAVVERDDDRRPRHGDHGGTWR